ncbi:MAG: GlsB/YeaQ/YmgE family stress response membrane protein [Pseudolabrys sp.]
MQILWLIIIGFVAGIIAKFLDPGSSNEPSGFILTTLLGIAGSFVATYLGQALGWYQAGEGAGLIGAVVGAIVVLVILNTNDVDLSSRGQERSAGRR